MPQASPANRNHHPQQKPPEQISVTQNEVLAETIYNRDHEVPVQFAIKTFGGITIEPHLNINTQQIIPPSTTALMAKPGVVLFPSQYTAYGTQDSLVREIKGFIHRYADISAFREDLTAHFLMMTWVYDLFTAVPYLRFLGEPATGKSRMLQVAGHLAYRGIFAGGATTSSPLFRLIEVYRGTVVIDEADYKASDAWVDIIKILNSGYMKGVPVLRSEKVGDTYEPRPYDVYGPKIIGNRFQFDDWALETRCITLEMDEHPLRRDIPRQLPPKFYVEAQDLRNKLLQWRFDNLNVVRPDESALLHLEPRLTQIGTPIYSVSTDDEFRRQFVQFLSDYGRKQQTEKPQAVVVEALAGLMIDAHTKKLTVQEVTDAVNRICVGRGATELSAKAVGGLLRSMGFKPTRTSDGYQITVGRGNLQALEVKYPPAAIDMGSESILAGSQPEERATVN
jgi:hypothetical protein